MSNQNIKKKLRQTIQAMDKAAQIVSVRILVGIEKNPDGTYDRVYKNLFVDPINRQMMVDENGPLYERESGATDVVVDAVDDQDHWKR